MKFPRLNYQGMPELIQKNFEKIQDYFHVIDLLKFEWKFVSFSVSSAVTAYAIPHNCGFTPRDVLTTAQVGTITFLYDQFTDKNMYITTSGAASFRGLLGNYGGGV